MGKAFPLTGSQYIVKYWGGGQTLCFSGFIGFDLDSRGCISRCYYTEFDYGSKRLRFAAAISI
jgi:hypothetical protein